MVANTGGLLYLISTRGLTGEQVNEKLHDGDGMFKGNMLRYLSCGKDALFNVAMASVAAGSGEPSRILDFACGFGRVGRHLRAAFPSAEITFTDVMPNASAFCAATFDGRDEPIKKDFSGYEPQRKFDLIWVGSLFTHLPEANSDRLINLLFDITAPGGIIVFTSHGRYIRDRRKKETWPYAIDSIQYDAMINQEEAMGYGFAGYRGSVDYGISLVSLAWWERRLRLIENSEIVMLRERGWDRHQDVIAIRRSA